MAEGIFEETVDTVERYPFWIIGGALALLAVWWLMRTNSSSTAPPNFTFSYGPSDANIQAGTQLAIQQAADQTAVSIAQLQATSNNSQAGDYFGYLTTNSANNLAAQQLSTTTQGQTAALQIASQNWANLMQTQTNQAAIQAQTTQTGITAQKDVNLATIAAQSSAAIAGINASAQENIAATQATATMSSTNPIAMQVAQDFSAYLGRAPTSPTEEAYWINQIATGAETSAQVAENFRTGTEGTAYQAWVAAQVAAQTKAKYG